MCPLIIVHFCFPVSLVWLLSMGFEENIVKLPEGANKACQGKTVSVHAFSDLTHVSPVVFLYLLKECYAHGMTFQLLFADLYVLLEWYCVLGKFFGF